MQLPPMDVSKRFAIDFVARFPTGRVAARSRLRHPLRLRDEQAPAPGMRLRGAPRSTTATTRCRTTAATQCHILQLLLSAAPLPGGMVMFVSQEVRHDYPHEDQ